MRERYRLVDGLRGLAIVNMILYHFCYDAFVIRGLDPGWIARPGAYLWQQGICWTFIFLSGFSWHFSRNHNLRRGLVISLCGLIVTLVTLIAVPTEAIWFGVLTFIGCAVPLTVPLHGALEKVPAPAGMALCFAAFLLLKNLQRGYLGLGSLELFQVPQALYTVKLLTPLGLPYPGFRSSDYFPLFPWYFLFLTGYFFFPLFQRHELWRRAARAPVPVLSAIGQRSLWIYLIHQPLCLLLSMLLFG